LSDKPYTAHESAYVDEGARIGAGTRIWHFSHVMSGAVIGENCNLGQNVVVGSGAVIGKGCKIQNNVSLYDRVELEDFVFCGPSMVFTNVMNPRAHISRKKEYRPTLIRKGATIGANSVIVCGNTIGRYAFIGSGATVTRDVPDFALMYGNPARRQGWMCQCGIPLKFAAHTGRTADKATCQVCGWSYLLDRGLCREVGTGKDG